MLFLEVNCPGGYQKKKMDGLTFCYSSTKVAHATAKANCEKINMQLVEIQSNVKANILDKLTATASNYAWLGLVCTAQSVDCTKNFESWSWESSNGWLKLTEQVPGWKTRFTKTGTTITGSGTNNFCAHLGQKIGDVTIWTPEICTQTFGTLCEPKSFGKKGKRNLNVSILSGIQF